jgi:hypothetical protein
MGARSSRIGAQLRASRRDHGGTEIEIALAPIGSRSDVERPVHVA